MRDAVIGGLCSLALATAVPGASGESPDFSAVRRLVRSEMAARSIPGLSIAVARRGRILWEEGFGWADRENRIPATEQTMFNVASVTKTFTSTALMILAKSRKLDLDRPVNDYLPGAKLTSPKFDPAAATLRRVAMHTGGLTTFFRTCYADEPRCRISMEETIARYGVVFWPPGDHFDYSNLGYGILGQVVENASGRPLERFLKEEVFAPLGMSHSSLGIGPGLAKLVAQRYTARRRSPAQETATPGASGAYASAHDLALFGMFNLKTRLSSAKAILSDADLEAMQSDTVAAGGSDRYGLGWWVRDDQNGYRTVLAQGGTDDTSASLELVPAEGIAVAVLANKGDPLPSVVIDAILAEMLPRYRENLERKAQKPEPPPADLSHPDAAFVGTWNGTISTDRGPVPLTITVRESGDTRGTLGRGSVTALTNVKFDPKFGTFRFRGRMAGELNVDDAGQGPFDLYFELYVRGSALEGCATTIPRPESQEGNGLSFWVELKRDLPGSVAKDASG